MFSLAQSVHDLIDFVFPDDILLQPDLCSARAILAQTNHQIEYYNTLILDRILGEKCIYFAADSLKETDDARLPTPTPVLDYVAQHTLPGLPPHCLEIKTGCVFRLMRNFSLKNGLVKNARVLICALGD
jgi:hypothetical protein